MNLHVVAVPDQERAVGILIIHIVVPRLIHKGVGMEMLAVPFNTVDAHGGMVHIENLEFPVFITGGEDEVTTVQPLQSVGGDVLRLRIDLGIVPPAVLHHHGLDLLLGYNHRLVAVIH